MVFINSPSQASYIQPKCVRGIIIYYRVRCVLYLRNDAQISKQKKKKKLSCFKREKVIIK